MSAEIARPRGRPARKSYRCSTLTSSTDKRRFLDTPGTTLLTYTPNGKYVITGGSNSAIRVYTSGEDGEPKTIDEGVDGHFGIGATVRAGAFSYWQSRLTRIG